MQKPNQPARKFHHLIAGEIIFELKRENQTEEDTPDIHSVKLNAIITTLDGNVSAAALGRAQQSLQIQHMKRAGDQAIYINVVDVILLGMSNLGLMTDDEFNAAPVAPAQDNVVALKKGDVKDDPFNK